MRLNIWFAYVAFKFLQKGDKYSYFTSFYVVYGTIHFHFLQIYTKFHGKKIYFTMSFCFYFFRYFVVSEKINIPNVKTSQFFFFIYELLFNVRVAQTIAHMSEWHRWEADSINTNDIFTCLKQPWRFC